MVSRRAAGRAVRPMLIACSLLTAPGLATASPCAGMIPSAISLASDGRALEADDLLRLRDIGYSSLAPGQKLIALSPDQRRIAFSMYRADPGSNAYCEAIFTLDRTSRLVRLVDQGTELILDAYPIRGVKVDYGYPALIVPQWSPNGEWLAYLKRVNGLTQVWRVHPGNDRPEKVSNAPVDVDRFTWTADGSAIIYATRPSLPEAERSIDKEGLQGFLFDDRIVPYSGSRPAVRLPAPSQYWRADIETGRNSAAADRDAALLAPLPPMDPAQNMRSVISLNGRRTWTERREPAAYLSTVDLWAEDAAGIKQRCPDVTCIGTRSFGIQQLWWAFGQREVLFLRREGWGGSQTALYRWKPGAPKARRLFLTNDLLLGCELVGPALICAREGATQPRRLVTIDLRNGRDNLLFEPNPEFAGVKLGSVERLRWLSPGNVETYGDLVLPPGDKKGAKLPLIIVQYTSTGFLRGGVGDEYPIQLFAKEGYAVLSFNAPPSFPPWDGSKKSFEEVVAETSVNWVTRRKIFASLETGVQTLIDRGIVAAGKIGISGPSDGSTTVQVGLVNRPDLFAAASVSSCCIDPSSFMLYGGIGLAEERARWGFPPARGAGSDQWKPLSIALNANAVKTPILMQLADHEYLISLDTFMSLRNAGTPVEMFIYPGEYHLMWQPAHRRAAYLRNIDWFDFWLRGRENVEPEDPAQYGRWRAMRVAASGVHG